MAEPGIVVQNPGPETTREQDLIARVQRGQNELFYELVRPYERRSYAAAFSILRNEADAEDVVQDVFTGIQARPGGLPRPETAMPYLRAAVINRCRSALRRRAVAWRLGGLRDRGTGLTEVSAEADVIRAEERREVLAALTALPARRREVLVLRYYLGLSEAEIATTLGISQGTVKSTAARGIAALAKALGEDA